MRGTIGTALALALAAGGSAATIDPEHLSRDIEVLASDAFEGRGPATPGETKTIAYVTEQMKAAGLQPGGDPGAGGRRAWTQDVPLLRAEIRGAPTLTLTTASGATALTQGSEIAVRAPQTGAAHVAFKDAPLLFVGYGVAAPEKQWDDFKGVDVRGKLLVLLINDPDYETGVGDFGGKANDLLRPLDLQI